MVRLEWLALSAVCWLAAAGARADSVIMTAKGSKQGEIKGGLTQKGREGAMQCVQFEAEASTPTDLATGHATGRRQHKPIRCVKKLDSASVPLLNALIRGEVLTDVMFKVFATDRAGREAPVYTVALKNASVASVKQSLASDGTVLEEVTFVFTSITYTWEDGKLSASDSLGGAR